MTPDPSASYPELHRVFSGYLHEDLFLESGTPMAAVRAFRRDAAPDELRRFDEEVQRFLAQTADLDFEAVRRLVHQLGSRWTPPSRAALTALLTDAPHELESSGEGHRPPR